MSEQSQLFRELVSTAAGDWATLLEPFREFPPSGLHLAVFVEPYLSFVLEGTKTVESRFSRNFIAPHGRVSPGDVILLKPSGKPIVGWCRASYVWDYELDQDSWDELKERFHGPIRAQDGFWESRRHARFATLIRVEDVHEHAPLPVTKRDRRGWVVIADPETQGRLL